MEMFHCPSECQAFALRGVVTALHISENAIGVANGLLTAFGVMPSKGSSEGGAISIRVEINLLAEIWLDESREGYQRFLQLCKGCIVGRSPQGLNVCVTLALAGKVIQRGHSVCKARDVITKEITRARI